MNINGTTYPSIGRIHRSLRPDGKYQLTIYPTHGTLLPVIVHDKREDVQMVEVVVTAAELERIRSVAPHLLVEPAPAKERTVKAQA